MLKIIKYKSYIIYIMRIKIERKLIIKKPKIKTSLALYKKINGNLILNLLVKYLK